MNIFQKLIEVRKSVPFLRKDSEGFQFKYVSSSQTLGALREAMDVNQLLLIPRVVKYEIRDHTTKKGDHNYFTILDMEFTWVNAEKPDETVICSWQGCGLDDGEKGTGKAVTYAEKYFLLKFFNIPTDKDDPDAHQQKKPNQETGEEKKSPPNPDDSVSEHEQRIKDIDQWILEMTGSVEKEYKSMLKRISLYEKDGIEHFLDKVEQLNGKPRWTNKVHHTTRELYEAWKTLQDNQGKPAVKSKKDDDGLFPANE